MGKGCSPLSPAALRLTSSLCAPACSSLLYPPPTPTPCPGPSSPDLVPALTSPPAALPTPAAADRTSFRSMCSPRLAPASEPLCLLVSPTPSRSLPPTPPQCFSSPLHSRLCSVLGEVCLGGHPQHPHPCLQCLVPLSPALIS